MKNFEVHFSKIASITVRATSAKELHEALLRLDDQELTNLLRGSKWRIDDLSSPSYSQKERPQSVFSKGYFLHPHDAPEEP